MTPTVLANNLFSTYGNIREEFGSKTNLRYAQLTGQSRTTKVFLKLAEILSDMWDEEIDVQPDDYIRAHFEFYKGNVYPNHLISGFSKDIWLHYMGSTTTTTAITGPDNENNVLSQLSEVRGESEEEIIRQFYDKSVFSADFLKANSFFKALVSTGEVDPSLINTL